MQKKNLQLCENREQKCIYELKRPPYHLKID